MIPGNAITVDTIQGDFLYLQDQPYTPLSQTVMGGVALQDGSQGRLVKPWTVSFIDGVDSTIQVASGSDAPSLTLPASGVQTVSLAFDANMSVIIAYQTYIGANLYYYDTVTAQYITRIFPGFTSSRVCVDNPLDFYTASSDVMFGYTFQGNLCYRQQRDRYNTEYVIKATPKKLIKLGMSSVNRLQFELQG